ncbi:MAG: hypothetical protein ACYC3I_11475 [Gemmataceae bacterium]
MPRKLNYPDELKALKGVPDSSLRPVTTRIPVGCLRVLYQLCDRENLDLSVLVRRILEDQASLYFEKGTARAGVDRSAAIPGSGVYMVHLQQGISEMAERVCDGLALDMPTLIQMILAEALPEWIVRAGKAQQLRQQALARLDNRPSPERATWDAFCCTAHPSHTASLGGVKSLIEDGLVELEVEPEAQLRLVSKLELTDASQTPEDHAGCKALKELVTAGVLIPDEIGDAPHKSWRLEPRALLKKAVDRSADERAIQRFGRRLSSIQV